MNAQQFQKHCELQALWWIASATTGACKARKLHHGGPDGPEFTDEEKVQAALNFAQNHIRLFRESCETEREEPRSQVLTPGPAGPLASDLLSIPGNQEARAATWAKESDE